MKKIPPMSSLARVAQFVAAAGEGNRFTKLALLAAVPRVAQADRRMRELREMGWVIDNYKSNVQLRPEQYLLRKIGVRIDLGERRPQTARRNIAGAKRRRILERDGSTCQICGIRGGEEYPDISGKFAVLTAGHIVPVARGGNNDDANLRAECTSCGDQARDVTTNPPEADEVLALVRNVGGRKEKERLYGWMTVGRRTQDNTDKAYTQWARLTVPQREQIHAELGREMGIQAAA